MACVHDWYQKKCDYTACDNTIEKAVPFKTEGATEVCRRTLLKQIFLMDIKKDTRACTAESRLHIVSNKNLETELAWDINEPKLFSDVIAGKYNTPEHSFKKIEE